MGTQDTRSAENIVSGLYGRTSLSAGQYYYNSDGFRENNGVRHEIYDFFAQSQLTDTLSVQAEYRYRDTHQGDLSQNFDLDGFRPDLDRDIEQHIGRFGARYSPTPRIDLPGLGVRGRARGGSRRPASHQRSDAADRRRRFRSVPRL